MKNVFKSSINTARELYSSLGAEGLKAFVVLNTLTHEKPDELNTAFAYHTERVGVSFQPGNSDKIILLGKPEDPVITLEHDEMYIMLSKGRYHHINHQGFSFTLFSYRSKTNDRTHPFITWFLIPRDSFTKIEGFFKIN